VWAVLTRLFDGDQSIPPPLEPMLPALAETVLFWSGRRRQVLVIHDEQSALTASRLSRLQQALADTAAPRPVRANEAETPPARMSPGWAGHGRLPRDPRVQIADLLAGMTRRLPGTIDGPLRPFLSPTSLRDPEP
jgi:hypothetical protein